MKILVTGAGGSVGSYFLEHVRDVSPTDERHAVVRRPSSWPLAAHEIHSVDLDKMYPTRQLLRTVRPDLIFNFASNADVKASFDQPGPVLWNNIALAENLFEAIRLECPDAKVVHASTPEVLAPDSRNSFGGMSEVPLSGLRARNPYAASKLAQEAIATAYADSFGIPVVILRVFSYINPRRRNLVASSFAAQIAEAETAAAGRGSVIGGVLKHGNLASIRTWCDVRDVCDAYWRAGTLPGKGTIYHVGSTLPVSVGDLLMRLFSRAKVALAVERDPALFRPVDVDVQIPDVYRFHEATGWEPKISLDESLDWLLDTWRARIAQEQMEATHVGS